MQTKTAGPKEELKDVIKLNIEDQKYYGRPTHYDTNIIVPCVP